MIRGAASAGTDKSAARRPSRLRLLQIGLTFAALAVLVWVVDWRSFLAVLASARLDILALGLALLVIDRVLMSYKWGLLLAARGAHLPLWENCGIYSLVTLAGMLLPATIGGDLIRAGWLWRRGVPAGTAAASIGLERAVGFAVALAFAAAGLAFLAAQATTGLDLKPLLAITLLAFALMLVALLLSFRVPAAWLPERLIGGLFGARLAGLLARLHGAYVAYRAQPGVILAFAALTIAEYLLIILATFVIARALGIEVGMVYFGAALAVALVIARLPIALDGIGMFEGAFALLLAWTGVPPAATVALAVCSRLLLLLSCAPPAIVLLWLRPIERRDLFRPPKR